MLLPKLKAPRPLLEDLAWCPLLPMHSNAFPAPPSPINTALSSCNRGGSFGGKAESPVFLKRERENNQNQSPPFTIPLSRPFLPCTRSSRLCQRSPRTAFPELHNSSNHFLLSRAKTGSTGKKTREQTVEEGHNRDEQKKTQKDQPARPRHHLCLSFLSLVVFFSSSGATKQQPTGKQRRSKKNKEGRTSTPQRHRQLIISFVPAAHTRRRAAAATPGAAPALPTTS